MNQIKNLLGEVICEGELSIKALAEKNKANLSYASLGGADLIGAYLTGARLNGAWLNGAYLTGADLRGADLIGADLRGADLIGAYLTGADLTGADLTGAFLRGADLTGAYLTGAWLPKSIMEANWGIPADPYTAFLLLSLKIPLSPEIAQAMLLNPNFCWKEAKKLFRKSPKIAKALKKQWPELYDKLQEEP
jgi:hypothetical protein